MKDSTKIKISLGISAAIITTIIVIKAIGKKKPIENEISEEKIPELTIRNVEKNQAGFVYAVSFTFGDTMDKYTAFDTPYMIDPYADRKSIYSLKPVTSEMQDSKLGTIYFNLYKNGNYVKTLYEAK